MLTVVRRFYMHRAALNLPPTCANRPEHAEAHPGASLSARARRTGHRSHEREPQPDSNAQIAALAAAVKECVECTHFTPGR